MSVKQGHCIKTAALIKVLDYGWCQRGDVFRVGDDIIINLAAPLFDGQRIEEATGYEVVIGLKGFYHEKKAIIVVPVEQFSGEVYLNGPEPMMLSRDTPSRAALQAEIDRLEGLRPHWAKGYTSDGVAAQVHLSALQQLWELLGVDDQTAAVTKLTEMNQKPIKLVADISGGALGGVWCERPARVLFLSSDKDETANAEQDAPLLKNFSAVGEPEAAWILGAHGGEEEAEVVKHYFDQVGDHGA